MSNRTKLVLNPIWLLILLCAAVYAELLHERPPAGDKCDLLEHGDAGVSAEKYDELVKGGYRTVRSRRVRVVPVTDRSDPALVLNNVCVQRQYLARLVGRLEELGASTIVFDKFFGAKSCPQKDPGTTELIQAAQSSRIPIVVGAATHVPPGEPKKSCLV